jgi:zinc transporter, ZIP family
LRNTSDQVPVIQAFSVSPPAHPERLPMSGSLESVLAYSLIPCLGVLVGSAVSVMAAPATKMISAFQHFAGGVVFAAVAIELLPELSSLGSPISMVIGFCLGVAAMLATKALFANLGIVVPMATNLFIDGILIAIGFAAGVKGGTVLVIGLTLETVSLGLSSAPALVRHGMSGSRAVSLMVATGVALLVGAAVGHVVVGLSGLFLAAILGFGVASLLYLVTEELLAEAHDEPDTPMVTATFFAGFLLPLVIAAV